MPKGILIPCDMEQPLEIKDFDGLEPLQRGVGGLIEPLNIERPPATIFVNEEGVLIDLPVNRRASLIYWAHCTRARGHAPVFGDAVLIGEPDEEGETQDVPPWYECLLFHAEHFKVQMQDISDMLWREHAKVFDDWQTAYNAVLQAAERNALTAHVRVVPA